LAALFLGAAAWLALQNSIVQDLLARRIIEGRLTEQREELFEPDALRVLFCGTSSPAPDRHRAKACVAVFAAGRFWLVDTGPGSWNTLGVLGVDASRIGAVFLTHFHSDHIGELGEVNLQTWTAGRPSKLSVYGPPGVEEVVAGFSQAYALDSQYRVAHHTASFVSPELGAMLPLAIPHPQYGEGASLVVETEGLRISAFPVRHDPVKPAYGYRFDYLGRSLVISGDTAKSPALIEASKGVELLIHEAMAKHVVAAIGETASEFDRPRIATLMADIPSYHTSPIQAARIANEVGAKLLVMYHLFPPVRGAIPEAVFSRGVSEEREGAWKLAEDGMLITLSAGSDEILTEQLTPR
jgi:ribonuclease Z